MHWQAEQFESQMSLATVSGVGQCMETPLLHGCVSACELLLFYLLQVIPIPPSRFRSVVLKAKAGVARLGLDSALEGTRSDGAVSAPDYMNAPHS